MRPRIFSVSMTEAIPRQHPLIFVQDWEKHITFKPVMNAGEINALCLRKGAFEYFGTADDEDLKGAVVYGFFNGFFNGVYDIGSG